MQPAYLIAVPSEVVSLRGRQVKSILVISTLEIAQDKPMINHDIGNVNNHRFDVLDAEFLCPTG
jgi:hypothetical protein